MILDTFGYALSLRERCWEGSGDCWRGIASRKKHKCYTVNGRVPMVSPLTMLSKGTI